MTDTDHAAAVNAARAAVDAAKADYDAARDRRIAAERDLTLAAAAEAEAFKAALALEAES